MYRTSNSLRLVVATTALLMALLAAPAAQAQSGSLSAPGIYAVGLNQGPFGGPPSVGVAWLDINTNEDGFTVEWWAKIKGKWVLQESQNVPAGYGGASFANYLHTNRYRVRAFNASRVSAWSNWAELTIK